MAEEIPVLDFVKADGGRESASADHVTAIRTALDAVRDDLADNVHGEREASLDTRLCRWSGQSDDGRKHADNLGKPAKPFDGASDTRPFTSDGVINYIVAELTTALQRATPRDMGMESTDGKAGGYNSTLIKWLVKNQWSVGFENDAELLAQYIYSDSPAGAVLWVDWEEEMEVVMETLPWVQLLEEMVSVMPMEPTDAEKKNLLDLLRNPDRAVDLRMVLKARFPKLSGRRVNKIATQIYKDGEAEFPVPREKGGMPRIAPLRQFEDVLYPRHITNLQASPWIIRRTKLTAAQVRESAAKFEWSKSFVDDLLEVGKGRSCLLDDLDDPYRVSNGADNGLSNMEDELYEVLHVFARAVNEDGIPGIYWQTASYFVDKPATDRHLFDRAHGKYPFVHFSRERLTASIADGRGVPEILATDQNSIKLLDDSFEDHTQMATNPVRKIPQGAPAGSYVFTPCGYVEVGPREHNVLGYIDPPQYPKANQDHYMRLRKKVGEYWGIPYDDVNEAFVVLFSQKRVNRFLNGWAEVFMMSLQLIHEKMAPERIGQITGQKPENIAPATRDDVQGRFNVSLSFDVRDLNMEWLLKKSEVALNYVRAMDDGKRIDGSAIAVRILESMDPNWADESVRGPESANQAEAEDEKENLALMLQGVRPDRPDDNRAQNFPARLQVLQKELSLRQQNPDAFPEITPAAAAILQEQMEYLGFQTQQRENAKTGRLGYTETDLAEVGQEEGQTGMSAPRRGQTGMAAPRRGQTGMSAPRRGQTGMSAPRREPAGMSASQGGSQ